MGHWPTRVAAQAFTGSWLIMRPPPARRTFRHLATRQRLSRVEYRCRRELLRTSRISNTVLQTRLLTNEDTYPSSPMECDSTNEIGSWRRRLTCTQGEAPQLSHRAFARHFQPHGTFLP